MSALRIVSIRDDFFSEFDLNSVDPELLPNKEHGNHRPYVIVLKLKYRGKNQDFAIPFRSNIAGYRDKTEYFSLPPRKETKQHNVHGLHFIKMFPVISEYFSKYIYPDNNKSAITTRNFIQKNLNRLVKEAQAYLDSFELDGFRPEYCVDVDALYNAIHKNDVISTDKSSIKKALATAPSGNEL